MSVGAKINEKEITALRNIYVQKRTKNSQKFTKIKENKTTKKLIDSYKMCKQNIYWFRYCFNFILNC